MSASVRRALDQAVRERRKPLADLSLDEVEETYRRTLVLMIVQGARRV